MWAYESVFYQIYPLGFCGAPFENDGVLTPRIRKVIDWIPHIKNLGANAIYFSPVFESDTHGYNTRDFRKIDVRLGTNEDFADVCQALHKEGIKVVLDGVCVTGGEPTLDPDLERFVTKIKELGYLVKLDTNGYRPEILKKLVEEKKIDYVAMDIKNAPSRYGETAGVKKIDVMRINESVEFLKSGMVDYEFRTTLCKELHGREEIEAIGKWLSGAKRYFLQNYRESDYVIDPRFSGYAREQLERFCEILRGKIETVEIRGVD